MLSILLAFALYGTPLLSEGAAESAKGSAAATASNEKALPGLVDVLGDLRKGGLVIYLRHATTEQAGASDEAADLGDCKTQRNLSALGRTQATRIGEAFRALGIRVSSVMTSPFCRCKETGQLAFGRIDVNKDLYFAITVDAERTKELADTLRRTLATPPPAGTNAVLVSHSANLREATGLWPKPEGVAYIFRPLSDGRFEVVAKVLPEDWVDAAKRQ